jgi:hypothetical protein
MQRAIIELRGGGGPVLELGSGAGVDRDMLSQLGALVALDYSRAALVQVRGRVPAVRCVLADLRSGLPFHGRRSLATSSDGLARHDAQRRHRAGPEASYTAV